MEANELLDETLSENRLMGAILAHIGETCEACGVDYEAELKRIFLTYKIALRHNPEGSVEQKLNYIRDLGNIRQFAAIVGLWEMGMKKGA